MVAAGARDGGGTAGEAEGRAGEEARAFLAGKNKFQEKLVVRARRERDRAPSSVTAVHVKKEL